MDPKTIILNVTKGIITKNSNKIIKSPLKINLFEHQKAVVQAMIDIENDEYQYSNHHDFGLITDNAGTGKSIILLALISIQKNINLNKKQKIKLEVRNNPYYNRNGKNINEIIPSSFDNDNCTFIKSNLFVVPHSLHKQWEEYITNFTDLTYYSIKRDKDIFDNIEDYNKYDIILCKNSCYNTLARYLVRIKRNDYDIERNNQLKEFLKNYNLINLSSQVKEIADDFYYSFSKKTLELNLYNNNYTDAENSIKTFLDKSASLKDSFNDLEKVIKELNIVKSDYLNHYKNNNMNQYTQKVLNKKGYVWERIIFDESDSINITNCEMMFAKFIWFVSSSYQNLIFPNRIPYFLYNHFNSQTLNKLFTNVRGIPHVGFIRDILSDNMIYENYEFLNNIFIKTDEEFLNESIKEVLPEPIINKILCKTPVELLLLDNVISDDALKMLNADCKKEAFELLGFDTQSEDDLIENIKKDFDQQINKINTRILENEQRIQNYKLKIMKFVNRYKEIQTQLEINKETISNFDKEVLEKEIKDIDYNSYKYREQVKMMQETVDKDNMSKNSIQNQYNSLNDKIILMKENICPITKEPMDNPVLIKCCNNFIDLQSLLQLIQYNFGECPLCRADLNAKNYTILSDVKVKLDKNLRDKIDELMSLLEKNGKFLIFSEFDNTFKMVMKSMEKNNIPFKTLKGAENTIHSTLDEFKKGTIKVLLLNAKFYGSGLNITDCTDIVFMHRMDQGLEHQVIGRGQRIGRKEPLNINYLCYNNELY
jgi:hypothetical protein